MRRDVHTETFRHDGQDDHDFVSHRERRGRGVFLRGRTGCYRYGRERRDELVLLDRINMMDMMTTDYRDDSPILLDMMHKMIEILFHTENAEDAEFLERTYGMLPIQQVA